jgi:putative spermidine/putrescine transport system substrate-binding protein
LKINELDPEAGSADQLEAIRQNQGDEGPQAPDVIDIGLGYTGEAQSDGLITPYKVSSWDSIPDPVKDPAGSWWGNYFGVLTFVVNPDAVENIPQDWDDLLKPEYKGKVAMGGEVTKSNQAVMTVMAAGLSRTNGEIETAPEAGLQFWKEMKASGNLLPVIGNQDTLASGETPIVILWDYLALADRDLLAGNPNLEIVVPETGVLAGPYANAISAYAPHPNAARLWSEFIMSDEGQLLFLEGYAHPIRFFDMLERGVIPQDILDRFPPADAYKQAVFLTPEEMIAAKDYIVKNWVQVVGD